jgi:hypothetical protein
MVEPEKPHCVHGVADLLNIPLAAIAKPPRR